MSDMADGQQTAPEAQAPAAEAGEAQTPQNDAVMARLDEMAQQMSKLAPPETDQQWQGGISDLPYAEGDPSGQPGFDQGYGDFDDTGYQPGQYAPEYGADPAQAQAQAAQQLEQYINDRVMQATQQAITPHIQRQKAEELERRYPQLADPKTAGQMVQATAQFAQRLGKPELARDPELVELVFLAQQARSNAAQETPADSGNGVHLEGGGAAPQQPEEDAGDRMLKAWGIDPATA